MKELLKLLDDIENDLKNLNMTESGHANRQLIFRQYRSAINSGQYPKSPQSAQPDSEERLDEQPPRTQKKS